MPAPADDRTALRLRPATTDDAALLFDWFNRPDSLAASLETTGPVAWDNHRGWLATRLADPRTCLCIIERDGAPIGQVRLQDKGAGPEIGIYIDAGARGAGIADAALAQVLAEARAAWPGGEVIARVRLDNERSQRLFVRAGFAERARAADHLVFVRAL
jgi:UDP-2,4-diacetamido-2,4,6-trideoxy-beta-L-altropyranose hydrolase